ncbi:MAG: PAS domain-containing protein [Spirochaetaceae bacterium]
MKRRGKLQPTSGVGKSYTFRHRRAKGTRGLHGTILETLLHATEQFSFWAVDAEIRYLYFNETHRRQMEQFWGTRPRRGWPVLELVGESSHRDEARVLYERALAGETITVETAVTAPRSRERTFQYVFTPIPGSREGQAAGVLVVSVETTVLRRQEEALQEAEVDRELLTHKLDHQVKNTIQSVISTLTRELEELPEVGRPRLERSIQRLTTLSHLYDSSITGERLAFASLTEQLGQVVSELAGYGGQSRVAVVRRMEPITMATTSVIPICQLAAELLSTILDQVNREEGAHILVTLERRGEEGVQLCFVVTHAEPHTLRSSSFAGRLVEDLGATLEVESGPPRTLFLLRFGS